MNDSAITLVLLDPSSDDGEAALDLVDSSDTHLSLLVMLTGASASALRDFATAENTDTATAAWIYLDQVVERLADRSDIDHCRIEMIVAHGPDPVLELGDLAHQRDVRRILVPPSCARFRRKALATLGDQLRVPVIASAA